MKTCQPRSLTMRFALQLHQKYGSKWLLDELHSLGLSESYQEVINYKYCLLRSKMKANMPSGSLCTIEEEPENEDEVDLELQNSHQDGNDSIDENIAGNPNSHATDDYEEQYVGDNIDLNIVSINGNTPFHAMGMIKVPPPVVLMMNSSRNKFLDVSCHQTQKLKS